MRNFKNENLAPVIVLDISYAGYGIIRSLHGLGIPIFGVKSNRFCPEQGTRLCEKILKYSSFDQLLNLLITFAKTCDKKPFIYITSDVYVNFISSNIVELNKYYYLNLPSPDVIKTLIDKTHFYKFAEKEKLLIPRTIDLNNPNNINLVEKLTFPLILKPWLRTEKWKIHTSIKAFLIHSFDEFIKTFNLVRRFEKNLLVQEYIPGGDENVYYCLTYFNEKSECLAAFTGQKIRQWPILTGSTSTTQPTDNPYIKEETIRIFKSLNYIGFGSVEYKKHSTNGKYYITEPTVGRLNQQEYVATLNNLNIPLIAYNSIYSCSIQSKYNSSRPITYIDEINEIRSSIKLFKQKSLSVKKWINSIKGPRAYRYCNKKDTGVFFALLIFILFNLLYKFNHLKFNSRNSKKLNVQ